MPGTPQLAIVRRAIIKPTNGRDAAIGIRASMSSRHWNDGTALSRDSAEAESRSGVS